MIHKIEISNFKSIDEMEMECKILNLLIGVNSSGKSTIHQALLFVGQNLGEMGGLNGSFVALGGLEENQCMYSSKKNILVTISDTEGNSVSRGVTRSLNDDSIAFIHSSEGNENCFFEQLDRKQRKLQYLSCHRLGPQNLYRKNMAIDDLIGNEGEFAISYLNQHGNERLQAKICKGKQDYTLLGQVNWWLSYITCAEIFTEEISGADAVKASYRMYEVGNIRPGNIGSGISYLISILIMCLSSPDKAVLVIENPEIHLHPAAQSKVCEFLYFIAESGRQLFVETHSDHIFNGFRAGIATENMNRDLINIEFVSMNKNHTTEIMPVQIGRYGKVENQKKDLFDQFDIDLNRMIGL